MNAIDRHPPETAGPAGMAASVDDRTQQAHGSEGDWALPEWLARSARWNWRLLLLAFTVLAGLWLMSQLRLILVPVLIGLLLAALASPAVEQLVRFHVPRIVATWLTLAAMIALLAGVGYVVGTAVFDELANDEQWNEVYDESRQWLRTGPAGLTETEIDDLERQAQDALTGGLRNVGVGRLATVVEVAGAGLLSVVLFFFFLKDGRSMWSWVVDRFQPQRRSTIDNGGRAAFSALKSYIGGVALTGVVEAILIGGALYIIGVPLVVPLAVLTFFAAFFPIVGATVAGALAALVALVANGPQEALLVAGAALVVQQVEGDILLPLIMRRQVKLHPAVILVVLAAGGALAGVVGAFVAVPLAAMVTAAAGAIGRHAAEPPIGADPGVEG